ncbi:hypothetical protein CCC_00857 [Paramagnetospirillum magnetotacticum MS-1]|uniref:Uncharacterized protein n=1 Tax=Paramagnetospirillum magnetotacticum MS-1 TaxID=272627 RepID=A0A0C2UYB3_PARME|nr:hypothetical protein CCC_00857 [Paramagnetospirillum magnetotacticum MS-1]
MPAGGFKTLVLLSHPRHIAAARRVEGALVVSTDWMVWQDLARADCPAVFIDQFLLDDFRPPADVYVRYGNWCRDLPPDLAEIAATFNRELEILLFGVDRLSHALESLCRRYPVERIVLLDARTEYGLLDDESKQIVVRDAARRHGAVFENQLDSPSRDDPYFPDELGYGRAPKTPPRFRSLIIRLACAIAEGITCLATARTVHRVLLFLNPMMEQGLIAHNRPGDTPVLIVGRSPKTPAFVLKCLRRGVRLGGLRAARSTALEIARVDAAITELRSRWRAVPPADVTDAVRRHYVENSVLGRGRLHAALAEFAALCLLLRRNRIVKVVVGDATNPTARLLSLAARREGAEVDELLNGMFVHDYVSDTRCAVEGQRPGVDRMLTWGRQQELWLRAIGSPLPCVRVGYPGLDPISVRGDHRPYGLPPVGSGNVLLLPIVPAGGNLRAIKSQAYPAIVAVARMLAGLGYGRIRLKLHPGYSPNYYHRLNAEFGLGLEIVEAGLVPDHLSWADLVIGPVDSGALVETLAFGRPYFALAPRPHSLVMDCIGPLCVYSDAEALGADLAAGRAPDREAILDHFCGGGWPGAASETFWRRTGASAEAED